MRTEYLVIIESDSPFCRDRSSFNNFLQADADIKIHKNTLKHRDFECVYELKGGDTEGEKNRFFHVKLECKTDDDIEKFHELLKAVRSLLHKASYKKPQVLWDDVSFYYAKKAYPLVHQIENLMRKLITKFMLTNVGLGWLKDAMPDDLRRNARSEESDNNNYLYETDFKDLSTFLFDEYRTNDIKALNEKILAFEGENISKAELKGFLPKSNWERYFREYVNCEGSYLQSRWEKLYKLRCKIAHNNAFTRMDFDQTVSLINDVSPKIIEAIANLDRVEVPEEERDELAEVVAIKTSTMYGECIIRWKEIEKLLLSIYHEELPEGEFVNARKYFIPTSLLVKKLTETGQIGKLTNKWIVEAFHFRNRLVHEPGHQFSSEELKFNIENFDGLIERLNKILDERAANKAISPYDLIEVISSEVKMSSPDNK